VSLDDRVLAVQEQMTPWLPVFIAELLRSEGDTDSAAEAAHVTVAELHALREKNAIVRKEWDRAIKTVRSIRAQRLEAIAYHTAAFPPRKYRFTPVGDPVMHPEKPGEAYYEEDQDNKLVMSLLQSLDRETYGPRQVVSGPDGGPIQVAHAVATLADVVRISALLEKGDVKPDEIVGEILDAEVVDDKAPV
jgi:hypothetical protein